MLVITRWYQSRPGAVVDIAIREAQRQVLPRGFIRQDRQAILGEESRALS